MDKSKKRHCGNLEMIGKVEKVPIKLLLSKEDFELVERISGKLGLDPASWINIVVSSKLRDMYR